MNDGYIKLYRQIVDNPLWKDKPFARGQAWADLLMKANFKDCTTYIKGQRVTIRRGQVLRSIQNLAADWGWSDNKVRRFLDELASDGMIRADGRAYGTLITVENYETFQSGQKEGRTDGRANGRPETIEIYETSRSGRRADDRADDRADGRGEKKEKKEKKRGDEVPPSLAQVSEYVKEMGYRMDPEKFFDYYSETDWHKKNGQLIRDWRASVRTWERREQEYAKGSRPSKVKIEPPKYRELKPDPEPDPDRGPYTGAPDDVREKMKKLFC